MAKTETQSAPAQVCWSCGAEAMGRHFCAACGRIQPLPRDTDYFSFLGLPQKLRMDAAELERKFHQLNWKLHPDNFARSAKRERELADEQSAQVNDAYRTLRDPVRRVEYLLLRAGVRKEGTTKQQAPPGLLEEVFELNEWLDELRTARQGSEDGELSELRHRLEAAQHSFESKLGEVDAELERAFAKWDAALEAGANETQRGQLMGQMNEILNRRSYIRNLVANVQKELSESIS